MFLAGGLAPILLFLIYFKLSFASENAFYRMQTLSGAIQHVFELSRHRILLSAFLKNIVHFGDWSLSPFWLLAPFLAVTGLQIDARHKSFALTCAIVLATLLGGYYFVYLTEYTPTPALQTHLDNSLDRLMLQLWPMFILLFSISIPEEIHHAPGVACSGTTA